MFSVSFHSSMRYGLLRARLCYLVTNNEYRCVSGKARKESLRRLSLNDLEYGYHYRLRGEADYGKNCLFYDRFYCRFGILGVTDWVNAFYLSAVDKDHGDTCFRLKRNYSCIKETSFVDESTNMLNIQSKEDEGKQKNVFERELHFKDSSDSNDRTSTYDFERLNNMPFIHDQHLEATEAVPEKCPCILPSKEERGTYALNDGLMNSPILTNEKKNSTRYVCCSENEKQVVEDITSSLRRFSGSDVPSQVLYPATPEDIKLLSMSPHKYPAPIELEGGIVVRLVRLSDPVTSPVGRVMRNRQYGIRGNERWKFLSWGVMFSSVLTALGFWQWNRMKWKAELINFRRNQLALPRVLVTTSPFPWTNNMKQWAYRTVEIRGVLDVNKELRVGPRPGLQPGNPGFTLVYPLRLSDGSTVLINRGHCSLKFMDPELRKGSPEWVTIRAVIEPGEIVNSFFKWKKIRNRPHEGIFILLDPSDLGSVVDARNIEECKLAVLTAYDIIYDDDLELTAAVVDQRKRFQSFEMRQKADYLLFWADEHTHFNYACQWFLMAALTMLITVYKFICVSKWKW